MWILVLHYQGGWREYKNTIQNSRFLWRKDSENFRGKLWQVAPIAKYNIGKE